MTEGTTMPAEREAIIKPTRYRTSRSKYQPKGEYLDFIRRRTEPFLDGFSLANRPIGTLLGEAYMQGLADATEVLGMRDHLKESTHE